MSAAAACDEPGGPVPVCLVTADVDLPWYADRAGELVGVLTHERDADDERGGELLARRAGTDEALARRAAGERA